MFHSSLSHSRTTAPVLSTEMTRYSRPVGVLALLGALVASLMHNSAVLLFLLPRRGGNRQDAHHK